MRLVLLGPPGAGKGTQAVRIAKKLCVPHISTGEIFRANVKSGTQLGREAKAYMDRGDLVPDDVVNRMVADRLDADDAAEGWLLDGYPRTIPQARALQAMLEERKQALDGVVCLEVPPDELARRIAGRAKRERRSRRRLERYFEKTAPLEAFYRARGLLRDIDAVGPIDEVTGRTLAVLEQIQSGARGPDLGGA
jgi:adenylate kinase